VPPLLPGYESPPSAVAFDPPRARALLAEAGHPDGRGLPRIGILYNTDDVHAKIAENVAWQLRRNLGLDVRAYNQEWQTWSRTVRALDYDLARASWIADYADPGTFLEVFTTGGGNNRTGWSDPAYDRLLSLAADVSRAVLRADAWLPGLREGPRARALVEAARGAPPGPARVEALGRVRLHLLREAEAILLQDAFPVMPLFFYVWSGLVRSRVQGLHVTLAPETPGGPPRPNLRDLHPLRDLRVLYRGERR
jgi:ABC-type oligopeptide transport system substrate-binding subunit